MLDPSALPVLLSVPVPPITPPFISELVPLTVSPSAGLSVGSVLSKVYFYVGVASIGFTTVGLISCFVFSIASVTFWL